MSEVTSSTKKKLTLSVDEEVIEKAKSLGLNLSEITEAVLRGFAFAPDKVEKDVLYSKYKELFEVILPLLKEYDVSVMIAEYSLDDDQPPLDSYSIYLSPNGKFWADGIEQSFSNIHQISIPDFLSPKKILSNFITALADSKVKREEQLEELEMVKGIIAAITAKAKKPKVPTKHDRQSDGVSSNK